MAAGNFSLLLLIKEILKSHRSILGTAGVEGKVDGVT
jgi:hypothetical protein